MDPPHTPSPLSLGVMGVACVLHPPPPPAATTEADDATTSHSDTDVLCAVHGRADVLADRHDIRLKLEPRELNDWVRKKQRPVEGGNNEPALSGRSHFAHLLEEGLGDGDDDDDDDDETDEEKQTAAIAAAADAALEAHLLTRPRKRRRLALDREVAVLQEEEDGGGGGDASSSGPSKATLRLMLQMAEYIASSAVVVSPPPVTASAAVPESHAVDADETEKDEANKNDEDEENEDTKKATNVTTDDAKPKEEAKLEVTKFASACTELSACEEVRSSCPFVSTEHEHHAVFARIFASVSTPTSPHDADTTATLNTIQEAHDGDGVRLPRRLSSPTSTAANPDTTTTCPEQLSVPEAFPGNPPGSPASQSESVSSAAPSVLLRVARLVATKGKAAETSLLAKNATGRFDFLTEGDPQHAEYLAAVQKASSEQRTDTEKEKETGKGASASPRKRLFSSTAPIATREASVSPLPFQYRDSDSDSEDGRASGVASAPHPGAEAGSTDQAVLLRAARLVARRGTAFEARLQEKGTFAFLAPQHCRHAEYVALRDEAMREMQQEGDCDGDAAPSPETANIIRGEAEGEKAAKCQDGVDHNIIRDGSADPEEAEVTEAVSSLDATPAEMEMINRAARLSILRGREETEARLKQSPGSFSFICDTHRLHTVYLRAMDTLREKG